MQASEMVAEMAARLREELRKHDLWATEAVALAVAEAVALDFYERGLREAAEIARNACLVPPDGGSPTPEEQAVAQTAHDRILSKLRSAT